MTEMPEPLVAAEVDLQDFPFMPLQVARLRDSNLAAEEDPEACWYAVLLWAASWHQLPAGSLPDNDTVLMRLVGLGRDKRTWKKHRDGALRGFVLCSDGRLYHPVVAEQANEAWAGKMRQRHRTFCAAVRKHNERNPENKLVSPTFEEWEGLGRPERVTDTVADLSRVTEENVTRDNGSKRQRQGQGQGQGDSSNTVEPDGSTAAGAASTDSGPKAIDTVKVIFDTGVRQLAISGKSDGEARSIIGRWRKQFGDSIVLAVLPRCEVERPSDPLEWITKALQAEARKAAGNGYGNSDRQGRGGSTRNAAQLALERFHHS